MKLFGLILVAVACLTLGFYKGVITRDVTIAPTATLSPCATPFIPRYALTPQERDTIERVVQAESGNTEPVEGIMGVCQVILDRTEKGGYFGSTITEVLTTPNCFSSPWPEYVSPAVKEAVTRIFDNGERITETRLYYFINPELDPISTAAWDGEYRRVVYIGRHLFYTED